MSVTCYLAGMTLVGLIATLLLRDRSGIPLGPDHEAEQIGQPDLRPGEGLSPAQTDRAPSRSTASP